MYNSKIGRSFQQNVMERFFNNKKEEEFKSSAIDNVIDNKINTAQSSRQSSVVEENQRIEPKIEELPLAIYLSNLYKFRKNEVLGKIEYMRKGEGIFKCLHDKDENTIILKAAADSYKIGKKELQMLLNSEFSPVYDPFKSYYDSLPIWSPEDPDHILALSETVQVKEAQKPYWTNRLTKFIVSILSCAINKDVANQHILIFTGKQAVGKTTWLEKLLPPSLFGYSYSGEINPSNKDSLVHMAECWLVFMDEMGSYAMEKADQFKELITKKEIRMRKYYHKDVENMPRRASLMGTTNKSQFLHDETGNRRFLVFETISILNKGHITINIDLVYAQAKYYLENGCQYWFSDDDVEVINKHNDEYLLRTFGMEIINSMFIACPEGDEPSLKVSASQLIEYIQHHNPNSKKLSSITLGKDLQRCGFIPRRSNGTTYYHINLREKTQ